MSETERIDVDPGRAALIIQDLQNDVMADGGAFAESGAPQHAKEQNVVENVKQLAEACRAAGIPVIHVHYIVEDGAPGLKVNAPLFQGVKETNALVRGTWGAADCGHWPTADRSSGPPTRAARSSRRSACWSYRPI